MILDALIALNARRDSAAVVGSEAIYLHTGSAEVVVAEATKNSDLSIDLRALGDDPLIEDLMHRAGFHHDPQAAQPGSWLSPSGIPVDLMVPDAIAGKGRRSVEAPPHDKRALRRAVGLEAAAVDNAVMAIRALAPDDGLIVEARVAGPAALMVAKLHKLDERQQTPHRFLDKDAYDVYRLLVAIPTEMLVSAVTHLLADDLAGGVTRAALDFLAQQFGEPDSVGSIKAGRAEELVGAPDVVAAACAALAGDLLAALPR